MEATTAAATRLGLTFAHQYRRTSAPRLAYLAAHAGEMYAPKGTFEHWAYKGWDWIINSTADWGIAMSLINKPHWV